MRSPVWKLATRAAALLSVIATSSAMAATSLMPPAYGCSAEDLALEELLRSAEVVDIEDIGEGITKPRRVTLRQGDRQLRAIFKTVDIELDEVSHSGRYERHFTDKYTYEAAAYRLDRLVGMGLVPVTVIRTIDEENGSLQLWIEDVVTLEEALKEAQSEVRNFDLLVQRLTLTYILDALIYNIDRNHGNFLVDVENDVFHPIDHSRAFRLNGKPPPLNLQTRAPIPQEVSEPLQDLELDTLRSVLGDLLEDDQIRAVVKRRDRLVKMLDRAGMLPVQAAK